LNEKTVKQKRVIIKKGDLEIYHRAYQMRFEMSADPRLLEFAYDAGLGEKTGMGFGMINIT
jgi:CRISPR-associated endoribonuclease Cas6